MWFKQVQKRIFYFNCINIVYLDVLISLICKFGQFLVLIYVLWSLSILHSVLYGKKVNICIILILYFYISITVPIGTYYILLEIYESIKLYFMLSIYNSKVLN